MERRINFGAVHAKAVETGRQSNVLDAGNRLAAVNILADHLWASWLQVELNQAEQAANHTG